MQAGGAPLVVLAAGGTGGHLFPAQALAEMLGRRGIVVELATDARAESYGRFPARATHIVASATIRSLNPLSVARTAASLARGTVQSWRLFGRLRPSAVVGFGGYPTLPPLLAARLRGIPVVIHEQNAVMGRGNRLLAPLADAIAVSLGGVLEGRPSLARKATRTGNPVRPAVIAAAARPYVPPDMNGQLRLLVYGGSQGARIMAEVVPAALGRLDPALQGRLSVVQQARPEDVARVAETYRRARIAAEIEPFFGDLPARIAAAHLVVCRSGASTAAELAAIGRPAILVPLPHALDQDQSANAAVLERAGGAMRLQQVDFTPARLAAEIGELAGAPQKLAAMAAAARSQGVTDGAERLADLVLKTMSGGRR
jgi:UDP-N-acetylglucosamine--N-acetylmuramyl-(pentapeptide) pyrophosphoryl-undecaprenol N-acetylglucosamine transferase